MQPSLKAQKNFLLNKIKTGISLLAMAYINAWEWDWPDLRQNYYCPSYLKFTSNSTLKISNTKETLGLSLSINFQRSNSEKKYKGLAWLHVKQYSIRFFARKHATEPVF
jgi:hypothetical protein